MNTIATIIVLALTVEAAIEYAKLIFVNKKINWKQVGALLLGVTLAVLAQVSLFALVGITFIVPYVDMALTGMVFSRGANFTADFFKMIQNVRANHQLPKSDDGEEV